MFCSCDFLLNNSDASSHDLSVTWCCVDDARSHVRDESVLIDDGRLLRKRSRLIYASTFENEDAKNFVVEYLFLFKFTAHLCTA